MPLRRGAVTFLVLPPLAWLVLFFVVPILVIGAYSLRETAGPGGPGVAWSLSLHQYGEVLRTPAFLRLLAVSVLVAAGVAASATLLAVPIAYFLKFRAGRRAALYLTLLLVPFAVSYLLRVMAWRLMLGPEGGINSLLGWLGVTEAPVELLLYSRTAVVVTLVYVWVPFATLPIYAAMQRIERAQLEAAADLGAGPWTRFVRITLPLAMPGAMAAFFMVFIPTVGEYVTPSLVGGADGVMYGNIVHGFFTRSANWPLGASMAMVMLLVTLVLLALAVAVWAGIFRRPLA